MNRFHKRPFGLLSKVFNINPVCTDIGCAAHPLHQATIITFSADGFSSNGYAREFWARQDLRDGTFTH
jgi:hypothetical protein